MTSQHDPPRTKKVGFSALPWLVAAAGLVVYLLTLNHWLSLNNLSLVARSCDWSFGPELLSPVFYVATYPFHWLPVSWVPLAYNLFSMVCAVLSLALLARSVILLPHDRTEPQRQRVQSRQGIMSGSGAWMPPVLAAALCGLQLGFWDSATTGSADMLDLLLTAYIIRCLLEYRVSRRDSWLMRAALVCGLGMANGWQMVGLFPLFLVALIWIKSFTFFDTRFLLRLFLFGLAGLSFYLVMPIIYVATPDHIGGFWDALRSNLTAERDVLKIFYQVGKQQPNLIVLLMMPSLLPILVISIRWASNFGDPSRMGSWLANWIFHLAHAALLAVCVWVAFDPDFSARRKGFPVMALSYFGALSVGYLVGYFLLVFQSGPERFGRFIGFPPWVHRVARTVVGAVLVLIPCGLIFKNVPQIRMTNGPALRDYAHQLVQQLPDRAVLLSDTDRDVPRKLVLAQAYLAGQGRATNYYFLDTAMLKRAQYHRFQQKKHPGAWPALVDVKSFEPVDDVTLVNMLVALSEKQPIYYLHPSFGYYFEFFDARPHGLVLELTLSATNSLFGAPLTKTEIAENENFWNAAQPGLDRLLPFVTVPQPGSLTNFSQKLLKRLHISFEPNTTAAILASYYSLSLNYWGVQAQRAGELKEAAQRFELSVALRPDNISAKGNLDLNRDLQAGNRLQFRPIRSLDEELGVYRGLQQALREAGPFDDPSRSFGQALAFAERNNNRQAAQQMGRAHELLPDNAMIRLALAALHLKNHEPQRALDVVSAYHPTPEELAAGGVDPLDIFQAEITALYAAGRTTEAEKKMQEAIEKSPTDLNLLARTIQLSVSFTRLTNALVVIDRYLQIQPRESAMIFNKGLFNLQLGHYAEAIPPFTQLVTTDTNNYAAQLLRGIAYMGCNRVDDALQDYENLQKLFPTSVDVNTGLGEIALRKQDTNSAIRYFEICLANASPEQARLFQQRLNQLRNPTP